MLTKKPTRIEWTCTHCGMKVTRSSSMGRPLPGACPQKQRKGPHVWVQNRKF